MNPELISLISGSLGHLAALVTQGAVSRIGEGFTESIAELLHEVATDNTKAEVYLDTFEDAPDDERKRMSWRWGSEKGAEYPKKLFTV